MIGALLALGPLAALSLHASLPPSLAWPGSVLVLCFGVWSARRESLQPARRLVWPAGEGAPTLDDDPLRDAGLQWRGTLAFLRWRDGEGRRRHLSWWPDTLPAPARRELRLAADRVAAAPDGPTMAP